MSEYLSEDLKNALTLSLGGPYDASVKNTGIIESPGLGALSVEDMIKLEKYKQSQNQLSANAIGFKDFGKDGLYKSLFGNEGWLGKQGYIGSMFNPGQLLGSGGLAHQGLAMYQDYDTMFGSGKDERKAKIEGINTKNAIAMHTLGDMKKLSDSKDGLASAFV